MVTPSQIEELLMPLVVRAHALRVWPQTGFVDQAAEYLVDKLELEPPAPRLPLQHRMAVERCKWIDNEVLQFLEAYPNALGVELGAGLSTRFQRLSARIDWPRFAWADVDSCDVIDCADLIFPRIDNYRLVPCDIVRDDWLVKTGWNSHRPLVVIIETLPVETSLADLKKILTPLINALNERNSLIDRGELNERGEIGGSGIDKSNAKSQSPAPIHLILDYASPALQKIRNGWGCMLYGQSWMYGQSGMRGKALSSFSNATELLQRLDIQGRVLNEQDLATNTRGPWMQRLLASIYRRVTRKCFWGAAHLRLDATRSLIEPFSGVEPPEGGPPTAAVELAEKAWAQPADGTVRRSRRATNA